jgi:hypothetical protein
MLTPDDKPDSPPADTVGADPGEQYLANLAGELAVDVARLAAENERLRELVRRASIFNQGTTLGLDCDDALTPQEEVK